MATNVKMLIFIPDESIRVEIHTKWKHLGGISHMVVMRVTRKEGMGSTNVERWNMLYEHVLFNFHSYLIILWALRACRWNSLVFRPPWVLSQSWISGVISLTHFLLSNHDLIIFPWKFVACKFGINLSHKQRNMHFLVITLFHFLVLKSCLFAANVEFPTLSRDCHLASFYISIF